MNEAGVRPLGGLPSIVYSQIRITPYNISFLGHKLQLADDGLVGSIAGQHQTQLQDIWHVFTNEMHANGIIGEFHRRDSIRVGDRHALVF